MDEISSTNHVFLSKKLVRQLDIVGGVKSIRRKLSPAQITPGSFYVGCERTVSPIYFLIFMKLFFMPMFLYHLAAITTTDKRHCRSSPTTIPSI